MVGGIARNPEPMKRQSTIRISRHPRQLLQQLATAMLASLLLAATGQAMAQNAGGNAGAQQSTEDADKAEAEKRRQAQAEAEARKAKQDKSVRDKSGDRKDPERELEEEEDI